MLILNQQFFSSLENKYKLLGTVSKQMPKMSFYSGLLELKDFKNILNKIQEPELLREQEINEIKNETKRELNMLDNEISNILEKLDVNTTTLELRCALWEKLHDFEKERELRLLAKKKK